MKQVQTVDFITFIFNIMCSNLVKSFHFTPGEGCGSSIPIRVIQLQLDREAFQDIEEPCTMVKSLEHNAIEKWIPGQVHAGEVNTINANIAFHFLIRIQK